MLWPTELKIAGATVPLAGVLADCTIRHGREDVTADPQAATMQLTLLGVTHAQSKAFKINSSVVLNVRDGTGPTVPRFTGVVTDASLDEDRLTLIAVGPIATLPRYVIGGTVDWPEETWSARVTRVFTEAGISSTLVLVTPVFNPVLVMRDHLTAGDTTLGDYLAFLAPMIGAAVVDRPDGKILVQPIDTRTLATAVALPPALVAYVPTWLQDLPHGNRVTVRYTGDQSQEVTVSDSASISAYGAVFPATIDTTFKLTADATTRANTRLARSAYSHWNMPAASLLEPMDLAVGTPVLVDSMPASAPYTPWSPILEGWTDSIAGDEWTMTLALSDPLDSGLTLPWNAVPVTATYHWDTINPTVKWSEALTLEDLAA